MRNYCFVVGVVLIGMFMPAEVCRAQLTPSELEAADSGLLTPVPLGLVPPSGTFYSWQRSGQAPLPFNPFPGLQVYDLGDGLRFLIDDRKLNYDFMMMMMSADDLSLPGGGGGDPYSPLALTPAPDYGSGLWLEIGLTNSSALITIHTNNSALITIHNSTYGRSYTIWTSTNLSTPVASWTAETNLTGASGDSTQVLIPMGSRSSLFFIATEARYYTVAAKFDGSGAEQNPNADGPDPMGAVGADHFVQLINSTISVYSKSGDLVASTNINDFFRIAANSPTSLLDDPRVLYDQQSGRWVAVATETGGGSGQTILAVSNGDSPTDLATGWSRYLLPTPSSYGLQAMGLDGNGIYVDLVRYEGSSGTNGGHTIIAIKKPEIYSGTLVTNSLDIPSSDGLPTWNIEPAVNFDALDTNGYTWLVAKGPPDLRANYRGGAILYRRLWWVGSSARVDTNWIVITNAGTSYQDYYDLDGTNLFHTLGSGAAIYAPEATAEGGSAINLHIIGSGLFTRAVVQGGSLWFCHHIGLSGTNGAYSGDAFGAAVDRSGVQWFQLAADSASGSLNYVAHGRIYDNATTNAYYYYFPSIAVNFAGDMVTAFSGSTATNYISAYYTWRLAGGSMPAIPILIQAGVTNYPDSRWGDYSATSLDPTDEWSFWTVQEYAGPFFGDPADPPVRWKTVIARIMAGP